MAGENLPLVGKLFGHRRHRTTAGYAHLADTHLVEAAERVGAVIAAAMAANKKSPALTNLLEKLPRQQHSYDNYSYDKCAYNSPYTRLGFSRLILGYSIIL